jgi:3,4-dihydroxy 2-butanone 4-phosphate synthase/GTP cyclohydrolase II
MYRRYLSQIEEIIEDAKAGRMVILVDDEDRENEGDLYIPADKVTAEAINFMARYGRGLICLAMTRERVEELGLPLMARDNATRHQTAFTVSIEAREGVTTGISAADRAHTIRVAIDPAKGARDIGTPGHVFPLVARDGGTLVRAGHTEAAVDIARLAGMTGAGVICEIMNDDGTMARLPDLVSFAQFHGLKVATIADLIAYRRQYDNLVRREIETTINSRWGGDYRMIVYRNTVDQTEHVALIKGDLAAPGPVMVRMHAMNVFRDVLGGTMRGGSSLHGAMKMIGDSGRGIIVLLRENQQSSLAEHVKRVTEGAAGPHGQLRDYGVGAQILLDLGVSEMVLLSNTPREIVGLDGYGLKVVETRATPKVEGD